MWMIVACKVVDAPEDLEALMVFGFVHAEDDERFQEETLEGLVPLVEEHREQLIEGFRVNSLTVADLDAVGIETDRDLDVIGVASLVELDATVAAQAPVLTGPDLEDVFTKTLEYNTIDDSDRACFLDEDCVEFLQHGTRVTDAGLLGTATQDFSSVFRWVEAEEDAQSLFLRQLSPDPTEMSVNLVAVHQSYSFAALFPHGDVTWRIEAYWADAEVIGLDVPDSLALDQAVAAMAERAEELDEFLR
jgi:hypothetical protein